MQETHVQSLGQEGLLEEEKTTPSSIFTWRIHGQRSLAGYSPWGLKRVRHNLAAKQQPEFNTQFKYFQNVYKHWNNFMATHKYLAKKQFHSDTFNF